jgi:glycosyltransferase involved in cell wall biosynthesis
MARAVLRNSSLVVTLSPAWEAKVRSITACRTVAIMNPVRVPASAHPELRVPGRVVCFGELGVRKGTAVLIRALALLRERGVDATLVLAGDGDPEPYREEARSLGVDDRVTIHSWLPPARVGELLDSASAFALPSQNEGLPVALLEALAHRLPCVVTPVGGIPDLIEEGRNGLLVPPDDPPALAESLARVLTDADTAGRLASAGHDDVARLCDLPVVVDQWDRALRGVLAASRGR